MATFYIEAVENTVITLSKEGTPTVGAALYGINNTSPATPYTYGVEISLNAGDKCYWTITRTAANFSTANYLHFTATVGKIKIGGAMSDLVGGTDSIPRAYCFYRLFADCANLVDASNLELVSNFNDQSSCYMETFSGCINLVTTPNFPKNESSQQCYFQMFSGCSSLIVVASLPAEQLSPNCYARMFENCVKLKVAPRLPAVSLASACYDRMFINCTNLIIPPELPATYLMSTCYHRMFQDCINLALLPDLPATTLAAYCYAYMFQGCTNIKISSTKTEDYSCEFRIPTESQIVGGIPTNALIDMFYGTGGTFTGTPAIETTYYKIPNLSVTYADTTLIHESIVEPVSVTYNDEIVLDSFEKGYKILKCANKIMDSDVIIGDRRLPCAGKFMRDNIYFRADANLREKLNYLCFTAETAGSTISMAKNGSPAVLNLETSRDGRTWVPFVAGTDTITLSDVGDKVYFRGDNSTISSAIKSYYKFVMTGQIAANGNILSLLDSSMQITVLPTYCYYYMFDGCTSLTSAPALPATTLAENCYRGMFDGCTSLTSAPALPATTLANYCYEYMFQGCTSLTNAPTLPATTLATYCYAYMFDGCTSLTSAPALPATTLAENCYRGMFQGCTSLTNAPALPATTLANYCYEYMFNGCTNLKISSTQTAVYSKPYRIPTSGTGSSTDGSLDGMFNNTGGDFTGTPSINTTYYLSE